MVNIIKEELSLEESLRKKIDFICDFTNNKPTIINGNIRKVDKTNLSYIEPHRIIINNTTVDEKLQQMIQTKIEEFMKNDDSKDSSSKLIESAKNGLLPDTSKSLSINIIYGITLIVLFIIIKICLLLVNSLANQVAKFPIIKQFNEIGGVLYGLLRGIIITYVILIVIQLVVTLNPNGALDNAMQESYLAKTMSTYNILNVFFKT